MNLRTILLRLGENRAHRMLILFLLILMTVEWILLLYHQRWLSLFLATLIILTLFAPHILRRRLHMEIPAEFHITAVVFIFASFYLGEIHDFYHRFWWWDVVLHTSAGFLMGILGFLLIYILNESRNIHVHVTPGFIAFFAFMFAVAIGALWEIYEFAMDQFFGTNMQKPMLDDPSGLTDTMWDMIVNAVGAIIISGIGYWYLKRKRNYFVRDWISTFINRNPDMFPKEERKEGKS